MVTVVRWRDGGEGIGRLIGRLAARGEVLTRAALVQRLVAWADRVGWDGEHSLCGASEDPGETAHE
jgi:hypothetical protein